MKRVDGMNRPVFIAVSCGLFLAMLFSVAAYLEHERPTVLENAGNTSVVPSPSPETLEEPVLEEEQETKAATQTPETAETVPENTENAKSAEEMSTSQPEVETAPQVAETDVESEISKQECDALLAKAPFYADVAAQVVKKERELRDEGRHEEAELLREISCFPHSTWVIGDDDYAQSIRKIEQVMAESEAQNKIPVFVLYNRPTHGYAGWESGLSGTEYLSWIEDIKNAIGSGEAWVILEPDALATTAEYGAADRKKRTEELGSAVDILESGARTRVYIDIGHSAWLSVSGAAQLLREANIEVAHGFALNVANFRTTEHEKAYGTEIATLLGDNKYFVVDTARNGNGPHPNSEWCNAFGRAIGERPRLVPEHPYLDALLWVKPAGESDGTCGGGPPAGIFWLEYALDLVRNR